ncbi:MAG TPA: hypothetical protein VGM32_06770 [Rhodopila sp.]
MNKTDKTVAIVVQGGIMFDQRRRNDRRCINGIHQTGEFAAFFVPGELVARTMTANMQILICDDNL